VQTDQIDHASRVRLHFDLPCALVLCATQKHSQERSFFLPLSLYFEKALRIQTGMIDRDLPVTIYLQ